MNKKFGLGKGINALIEDYTTGSTINDINIELIKESPFQPRKYYNDDSLSELVQSIKENGLIEPLVVRRVENTYEMIAGHRRLRALQILEQPNAPVYIIEASDKQAAQLSIIENVQRKDLNPIDLALSFSAIIDQFNLTHEEIAVSIGKSRVFVTNLLRLLHLDLSTIQELKEEKISESHGRLLLQITDLTQRENLLAEIHQKNLSVKELEKKISTILHPIEKKNKKLSTLSSFSDFEKKLSTLIHKQVRVKPKKIEIPFKDEKELSEIFQQFTRLYDDDDLKTN
ncbi:ParB/RepB/Spo0J family partition protein [bacterium]|nr:ParB/RepB/Spo0J family partition protein [bacterium]